MSLSRAGLAVLISAALLAPPAFAVHARHSSANGRSSSATHKLSHGRHASRRVRGQQVIDSDRVTQIQQALAHEHYLTADPNGDWDSTTVAAMQKYQADHGWQTKLMPDPRALKSLGLGPDYSTALNASGSSFSAPTPSLNRPSADTAGFIAASGVHQ
jgi:peptidoglycan hydrolase-like protein with peptidoglycan-binding domain